MTKGEKTLTVICEVGQCPFRSSSGFCRNKLVSINTNGMCGHIYTKNGQVKPNWQEKIEEEFMEGYKKQETE